MTYGTASYEIYEQRNGTNSLYHICGQFQGFSVAPVFPSDQNNNTKKTMKMYARGFV
jgi:hypothetical protein